MIPNKKEVLEALDRLKPEMIGGNKIKYKCYLSSVEFMEEDYNLVKSVIDEYYNAESRIERNIEDLKKILDIKQENK